MKRTMRGLNVQFLGVLSLILKLFWFCTHPRSVFLKNMLAEGES